MTNQNASSFLANPIIHSLLLACLTAVITTLTPYSSSSVYIAVTVFVVGMIINVINGNPAITAPPGATPSNPTGSASSSNSSSNVASKGFNLTIANPNANAGDTLTGKITGGTPNANVAIFDADNDIAITKWFALDATGSAPINYALTVPPGEPSPLGLMLQQQGSVDIEIQDQSGKATNMVTIG